MVFCNRNSSNPNSPKSHVTILILIDGFLQFTKTPRSQIVYNVTILILIDGFLQYQLSLYDRLLDYSHNPYFNRWFSAIFFQKNSYQTITKVTILILIDGFLQFVINTTIIIPSLGHNPYFNRWFSAICPAIV